MKKTYYLFVILFIAFGCLSQNELVVNFSNQEIEYWGRTDTTNIESTELYWSGTSIKINFEGESVRALLKDESGNNYYNIIIDSDSISIIKPDTIKRYYQLASNLSKGKHSIEIFKRTSFY